MAHLKGTLGVAHQLRQSEVYLKIFQGLRIIEDFCFYSFILLLKIRPFRKVESQWKYFRLSTDYADMDVNIAECTLEPA